MDQKSSNGRERLHNHNIEKRVEKDIQKEEHSRWEMQ